MVTDTYLLKRIEMLQEELDALKRVIINKTKKEKVTLRGIWKGVDITDEEIEEAKSSWMKE